MANAKAAKPTDDANQPVITIIKKAQTKSLEGKATLSYCLGLDEASALHWRIASNSGGGYFSDEWVAFQTIQKALEEWPDDRPITSMALRILFLGKSANNPSFLMATLVKEGVLARKPDTKRHYELGDVKAFLADVEKLKSGHSKSGKPKAKAKAKAGARMTKAKKPPAKTK
ncbi:hypothetical protein GPB2148_2236 [marine gamma proteobacterium HTCC2148]|nr:hypothetical protein GPB2148_2236 [marine gamma proteobacterium HTCC2148]